MNDVTQRFVHFRIDGTKYYLFLNVPTHTQRLHKNLTVIKAITVIKALVKDKGINSVSYVCPIKGMTGEHRIHT